jgi:large subunit ribosomal protein L5
MTLLYEKYKKEVIPGLTEKFGYKNKNQIPKLVKITINMGVGEAITDAKLLNVAVKELATITGQAPKVTKAKKAISNFKLRQGMAVGCYVTLRGHKMYEFLERLINIALPKLRDFRGLPVKGFDGRGNFNIGIKDHTIFPEINPDKVDKARGMDVSIVATSHTDEETLELLKLIGMPFKKK